MTSLPLPYQQVARQLLADHSGPDLRHVIVLLPNFHVARPLSQALAAVAGGPRLLPRFLTFTEWAASIELDHPVTPASARLIALYQALRAHRDWFAETADLWGVARELLDLLDELTREHITLPLSEPEFQSQLEQAYRARSNSALQFEARVVHELWHAMSTGEGLDEVAAYQRRLAILAAEASAPLYVLVTSELATPERRFLEAYAQRAPVKMFESHRLTDAGVTVEQDTLHLLSTRDCQRPDNLLLFPAHGLEQEAEAAALQVRRWLLAGKRDIAVVAQDRLVARRVRALLERAEILVQDETGWTFATLAVSAVLMRWLEVVQGDFYYQDVLDLLKSPFVFADQPAVTRKRAVYELEQLLRQHQVAARLEEYQRLAESEELRHALLRLQQAAQRLPVGREFSLNLWLERLEQSLDSLGVLAGWGQDAAGRKLLQLIAQWREELGEERARLSFSEWRRWLSQRLDEQTFRDMSVDSPVVFTHLAATRWRTFDAVLLLGCDADHLPGHPGTGQWFNDAVRSVLGLPVSADKLRQVRADLDGLLALNDTVLATWQESREGEPNLLSPWLERMSMGRDLIEPELATMLSSLPAPEEPVALTPARGRPQPSVSPGVLPQQISPSGYNALVACPYQYYTRYVLRLDELDEVREALDKRDYGEWVHRILQRFHGEIAELLGQTRNDLEIRLAQISDEVFAGAVQHDFLAHGWRLRWQAQQSGYLDWQLDKEHAGWRFSAAELDRQVRVDERLVLRGRLDRLDTGEAGVQRVLDYKTRSKSSLTAVLKLPGEDVQLACYATMSGAQSAAFVALDDNKAEVVEVEAGQDMVELSELNMERLKTVFDQLRSGVALPANGVDQACGYCSMRGLCRKGWWEAARG